MIIGMLSLFHNAYLCLSAFNAFLAMSALLTDMLGCFHTCSWLSESVGDFVLLESFSPWIWLVLFSHRCKPNRTKMSLNKPCDWSDWSERLFIAVIIIWLIYQLKLHLNSHLLTLKNGEHIWLLGRIKTVQHSYHKQTDPEYLCNQTKGNHGSWFGYFGLHQSAITDFTPAEINHTRSAKEPDRPYSSSVKTP